uniref:Pyrrolo-quinoline quinone n=1 Tax=Solibacter usitatus (strain Ellin6076) TaxID=234267 RepID=Q01TL8_SOLUE
MAQTNWLYIGIAGTVVALDRSTGKEIWRSDLNGDFVNVVLHDGDLYAAANGEVYCINPISGDIRWKSPLKGLGHGLITIAASGGAQTVVMKEKHQRDDNAAAAGAVMD